MAHPKLVESLLRVTAYPDEPDSVELIQTHISYIFIAGDTVYKIKKAVNFGFLDFSTLEKRLHYCNEELRLNRRLAGDYYKEVIPIYEDGTHGINLVSGERIIEYAVVMKKIPDETMLFRLLSKGKANISTMDAVAKKVFHFHQNAETGGKIDEIGGYETVLRNHEENFAQTEEFIDVTISRAQYELIRSYAINFLKDNETLFKKRVREHRIRDCHGDLHLQHISVSNDAAISDDIVIFDCIEFNERFRYLDTAAEIAFLSMDLDYNGYRNLSEAFVDSYIKYSSDDELRSLLNFYRCYFAYVRGKVTGFKLMDPSVSEKEKNEAARTASEYFTLALNYVSVPSGPLLIIVLGLMGTGKSVLAHKMARFLNIKVIRTDVLRKEILGIPEAERHSEDFEKGIYSPEITERTYKEAEERAEILLKAGCSVIIDGSFKKRHDRQNFKNLAERYDHNFYTVECVLREDILKERLQKRSEDTLEVSDGRWELLDKQKADFDTMSDTDDAAHIVVDTAFTPDECLLSALRKTGILRQ